VCQEGLGEVRADESGAAGDKNRRQAWERTTQLDRAKSPAAC
jgi:hypothetical protein